MELLDLLTWLFHLLTDTAALSYLTFPVLLSILVGLAASDKHRSLFGWFLASLLLTCLGVEIFGRVGIAAFVVPMSLLAVLRPLCPRCRTALSRGSWRRRHCPACGELAPSISLLDGLTEKESETTCERCGLILLTSEHLTSGSTGLVCFRCVELPEPRYEIAA